MEFFLFSGSVIWVQKKKRRKIKFFRGPHTLSVGNAALAALREKVIGSSVLPKTQQKQREVEKETLSKVGGVLSFYFRTREPRCSLLLLLLLL